MKCYERRDRNVRKIGFATYADYLASPLWARIRREAMERSGRRCECCGQPAVQVHHRSYAVACLLGQRPQWLTPICDACHGRGEWNGTKKRTLSKANHVINMSAWNSGRRVAGQCVVCKKNPTKAGRAVCGRCRKDAAATHAS